MRTVIIALRTLGNFKSASLTIGSKEGLRSWVNEVNAINIHEIVVETHRQRIGNSHKVALALRLHLVLLVANVNDNFLCLRRIDAEIGTTLRVNLRELIAGNSILASNSIGWYINLLNGNWQVSRTLGLETKMAGNSLTITATQLTITSSIEVQTVWAIGTTIRRDDLTGVNGLGQLINLFLTTDTNTLTIGLNDVTHIEVDLFRL